MTHDRGLTLSRRVRDLEMRMATIETEIEFVRRRERARLKEEADAAKL